jgi:hypothetical protein
MAADIATLSQLLQASLDPRQNKQGEYHCLPQCCTSCSLHFSCKTICIHFHAYPTPKQFVLHMPTYAHFANLPLRLSTLFNTTC